MSCLVYDIQLSAAVILVTCNVPGRCQLSQPALPTLKSGSPGSKRKMIVTTIGNAVLSLAGVFQAVPVTARLAAQPLGAFLIS